jgi:tetratricopeptide (TPR) repeat protein
MNKSIKVVLLICLTSFFNLSMAQLKMPAPSPLARIEQAVGLAQVNIEYSRPGVKDRKIFGGMLPYGELWRTGANAASKITFSEAVIIEGQEVPAGSYAIFSIPGKEEWTIILNKDLNAWGEGAYDQSKDQVRFKAKPKTLGHHVENLTFTFDELTLTGGKVILMWEKTMVEFPLETKAEEQVMAQIDKAMNPSVDANTYFQSATFYWQTGKDLNQALEWINTAVTEFEKQNRKVYWVYHTKANIEAELGKLNEALKTAEKSKAMADEAGNQHYVRLNEKLIEQVKTRI